MRDVKIGDFVKLDGTVKEIYFTKPDPTQPSMTAIYADKIKASKSGKTIKPIEIDGKISQKLFTTAIL